MASISVTFTATAPNGAEFTRTSGTMPYVAVLMVADNGQENWGPYSWHKSDDAALKAAAGSYHQCQRHAVVPAYPTALKGKVTETDFADGWGEIPASEFAELIAAKLAPKARKSHQVKENVTVYDNAADAIADITEQFPELIAAPAPVEPARKATKKQLLGEMVHDAVWKMLADAALPEGLSQAEAEDIARKWLQYIPTPATPGGWQPKTA